MTTSDEVGGNGKSGQKNQAAEAVEQTSAPSESEKNEEVDGNGCNNAVAVTVVDETHKSSSKEPLQRQSQPLLVRIQPPPPLNAAKAAAARAAARVAAGRRHLRIRSFTMEHSASAGDFSNGEGAAATTTAASTVGVGAALPENPVLPLFTQLNVMYHEVDETWRETSRWVKFQEDVEDGGKRWSKPYVPALRLSALTDLRQSMEDGLVALNVEGSNIAEIMDDLSRLYFEHHGNEDHDKPNALHHSHFDEIKFALGHRVKLRMKLNLFGRMTSVTEVGGSSTHLGRSAPSSEVPSRSESKESLEEKDTDSLSTHRQRQVRNPSTRPIHSSASSLTKPHLHLPHPHHHQQQEKGPASTNVSSLALQSPSPASLSVEGGLTMGPIPRANSTSTTEREKSMRMRSHNQFMKKVPRGAECCNIQAATMTILPQGASPVTLWARLKTAAVLDDISEITAPTRFLCIVLAPPGGETRVVEVGRALGTLMSDQIFPLVAYRARNAHQIFGAFVNYTQEVTVLAPSAWDPTIRLEPPKNVPSLDSRLLSLRQHHMQQHSAAPSRTETQVDLANGADDGGGGGGGGGDRDQKDGGSEDALSLLEASAKVLEAASAKQAGVPPSRDKDEALMMTGRLFGGLINDIKRRAPWIRSDFTDALHIQTIASIIYIYLATVTKAITFGGFLGDVTEGRQGVLESFLGHALAGGFFCLFGGQPLTVLGCTGPVLIFEKILVDFCTSYEIEYMTFRLWIGLWASLLCLVIVALDVSAIVRYFTRFTEESFAALIGIIFIVEALKKLYKMSKKYKVHTGFEPEDMTFPEEGCHCEPPDHISDEFLANVSLTHPEEVNHLNKTANGTLRMDDMHLIPWHHVHLSQCEVFGGVLSGHACPYVPDIFFFSVILFFGTFLLANALKKFKFTRYFPAKVRSLVSDYAVILAILAFMALDMSFNLHTPKLIVPTVFRPTRSDLRGWVIPFTSPTFAWWMSFAALVPALLLTILLFMDQQITSVIVNRSEHKLKKGCGYHLDMLVVGIMIGVCSVIGLPWCVAATVLCLGHVDSLKMETETSAPGETPQFLGVREQRVTGTMVFLLTGLSVKLAPVLKYIPMPVLYGVLMYMGFASLRGMQFIDRVGILFMPPKYQPDHIYLRHVPLRKVHLFTMIQIISLAALWFIKSTSASLVFPLMVLALVGFRKMMDYVPSVFSQQDLLWLDNLMPDSGKHKKKKKGATDESGAEANNSKGISGAPKLVDKKAYLELDGDRQNAAKVGLLAENEDKKS